MEHKYYTNPILHIDYSDPDAIRVGNDYFMIASSFCNAPGLPILHSLDLVHWELINYVLPKLPESKYDVPLHGCGVWAPALRYHEGTFFACFPMPDDGIYMSTTTNPYGIWSKPVNIRPGAGWIDPCPFWDEDGKAYLVAGVAKSRIGFKSVLHMVEMRPDGMGLLGKEQIIFDGNQNDQKTIEGPKLYKRNGYYYIFAPAGGVKTGWQTVLRSKTIYGPYEYKVVMRQGNTQINGPHQGAWVDTVTGENYFLHFQDVYAAGRVVHLQPMCWQNDWPIIGAYKEGQEYGEPVASGLMPHVAPHDEKKLPDYPATSDDFTGNQIGLQWQWNANAKSNFYSCKEDSLYLHAIQKNAPYGDMPNLLLQKWPYPEFACITELDLSHLNPHEEAGVISLGMEYGLVTIKREIDGYSLGIVRGKQVYGSIFVDHTEEVYEELEQFALSNNKIWIKYQVEQSGYQDLNQKERHFPKETVTLWYSFDHIQYKPALSMQAVPGRWVGVKNGIFCMSEEPSSTGSVKVCRVTYHKLYHNPVQRGFFPDPSVVRVGTDYYMVNSSFQYFPAIPISHSTDMIHWEVIGHAITDPSFLDLGAMKDSHGIWAPDIAYVNGRFIIMATLRLNGDGKRDNNVLRRQLVVTSDCPEGPYSAPAWIEEDDIDPSLFVDTDGQKYMLLSPGVNLVALNDTCTKKTGPKKLAWSGTGERCPEGPHLLKRGEYYYAILAEGGTGYGHGINVARSKNLYGPYEPSPYNPLLRQLDPEAPLQRCGHGKLIEDHNGNWWIYYLCGRPNQGNYTTIGRETALEPVRWLEDDWFLINDGKGPSTTNLCPDIPASNPIPWIMDHFDQNVLHKNWEFVRLPNTANYSLTERPGYFRIWTNDGTLDEIRAQNTLLRREQELSYSAATKVDFHPSRNGEQAGLTCYYSTVTYIRFSVCYEEGRKLQLVLNRNAGEELIASVDQLDDQEIYLKVEVDRLTRTFSYSLDGIIWISVYTLDNCIFLCDEGVPNDPKRHTGTLVGIYANNGGCGSRIPADFDFFSYESNSDFIGF